MKTAPFLAVMCLVSTPAAAQIEQVATPPPNLVLSNYNSASVGPFGGLEGNAFVARVGDPSAAWFNPAGLSRQTSTQISGSAGVYQRTVVAPQALPDEGGSIEQLPNFVGFTFSPRAGVTVGAALLTTNSWTQKTDSELISTVAGGQQRFAYSADSNFDQRVLAISAGYQPGGPWRFGGGFAFSLMDLRLVQTVSDRIANTAGLQSLIVAARADGSALQLRGQAGAQYDKTKWRLGGAIRTPAVTVHRSGTLTLDSMLKAGGASLGASVFDADARFEYHAPWEFQGGGAFVTDRFEVEVDLLAYTSIEAYSLLSTSDPLLVYVDAGANVPPTVMSRPFGGLTSVSDAVVNIGVGGHMLLVKDRSLRLHGSVGSNASPVAPGDQVFSRVDLSTWSLGVSGAFGRLQFGIGLNHQSGDADDFVLRNVLSGDPVPSPVDVNLTGFIYSLSYQF